MAVNIEMAGVGDLINWLEQTGKNVNRVENEALKAAAEPVLQDMKETTAFSDKSGELRKSIKKSAIKTEKYGSKYIRVGTTSPIAHLVELGHSGPAPAPAHPFVQPAYEKNKEKCQDIIRNKLLEALEK